MGLVVGGSEAGPGLKNGLAASKAILAVSATIRRWYVL
jgi:hypothetical protein